VKQYLKPAPAAGLGLLLLLILSCGPSHLRISTVPGEIQALEGYASLRITAGAEISRTKFSFVFSLPQQGRIEVSDFLGRSLYQILILPERAYFVVPSKKLYWPSREEEIMEKFLGFRLNLAEAVRFLSGRWHHSSFPGTLSGWIFQRDESGRVVSGQRKDLFFVIDEFMSHSGQMKSLTFSHFSSRGRLKILQLQFNPEVRPGVFSSDFLREYKETTWKQMCALINNAD
jgi:hypothetical protein